MMDFVPWAASAVRLVAVTLLLYRIGPTMIIGDKLKLG
jgi:hypothetical protein